ncbi:MAG: bifunctional 4-hydroxy-2-oxoglutarate aldolase/2-dehydro-3-deoxy-phosphogluconate aldolase [Kiritimatiellae bacterium]|nr:bifunctional 4-hydroxy-2-oxoglutarate aldolase/2-dehydro-3-deoxy-phosphogluconate aldolase [Kiritimatiellia bacterium]
MNENVYSRIFSRRIVPLVSFDDVSQAIPLADALLAGGFDSVEVTFRTTAAAAAIAAIARERPQMLVGAGTVLTVANLEAAISAGAKFAVAPGFNPKIVAAAQARGLPFLPGVATPTEVEAALDAGLTSLKFFPAAPMGGVKFLSAIYAPYRHTGVKFLATGGVSASNLAEWLSCPAVGAVGGSWLASHDDLAAARWDAIAAKCAEAARIAASI